MSKYQFDINFKQKGKSISRSILGLDAYRSSFSSSSNRGIEQILVQRKCEGKLKDQEIIDKLLTQKQHRKNNSQNNSNFYYEENTEVPSIKGFFHFYKLLITEKNSISRSHFRSVLKRKNDKIIEILNNDKLKDDSVPDLLQSPRYISLLESHNNTPPVNEKVIEQQITPLMDNKISSSLAISPCSFSGTSPLQQNEQLFFISKSSSIPLSPQKSVSITDNNNSLYFTDQIKPKNNQTCELTNKANINLQLFRPQSGKSSNFSFNPSKNIPQSLQFSNSDSQNINDQNPMVGSDPSNFRPNLKIKRFQSEYAITDSSDTQNQKNHFGVPVNIPKNLYSQRSTEPCSYFASKTSSLSSQSNIKEIIPDQRNQSLPFGIENYNLLENRPNSAYLSNGNAIDTLKMSLNQIPTYTYSSFSPINKTSQSIQLPNPQTKSDYEQNIQGDSISELPLPYDKQFQPSAYFRKRETTKNKWFKPLNSQLMNLQNEIQEEKEGTDQSARSPLEIQIQNKNTIIKQPLKQSTSLIIESPTIQKIKKSTFKHSVSQIVNDSIENSESRINLLTTMKSADKFLDSHDILAGSKGNGIQPKSKKQILLDQIFKNANSLDTILTNKINNSLHKRDSPKPSLFHSSTVQFKQESSFKHSSSINEKPKISTFAKEDEGNANKQAYLVVSQLKEDNLIKVKSSNEKAITNLHKEIGLNLDRINCLLKKKATMCVKDDSSKPKLISQSASVANSQNGRRCLTRLEVGKMYSIHKYFAIQKKLSMNYQEAKRNMSTLTESLNSKVLKKKSLQ